MKNFTCKSVLSFILLVALLSSCDNTLGVFSEIQKETKKSNSQVLMGGITTDFASIGGKYLALRARLASRSAAGSEWGWVTPSNFPSDYYCNAIAQTTSAVYAAVREKQGSAVVTDVFFTNDGITWAGTSGLEGLNVVGLFAASDALYASVRDAGGKYDLYYLNGGNFTAVAAVADKTENIAGAAKSGTNYYIAVGDAVYFQADQSLASPNLAQATGEKFSTVAAGSSEVFFGTASGKVYSGTTFPATTPLSSSTDGIASLIELPDGITLVAGLFSEGYYELASADLSSPDFCTTNGVLVPADASANPLKDKPVLRLVETGGKLFACVAVSTSDTSTLWRNDLDGTGWHAE